MSSLREKKLRFIEHLLTLGALLAVFLGFVTTSASLRAILIYFGALFVLSALMSYTTLLFGRRPVDSKWTRLSIFATNLLLGASFSAIILVAFADAFTGSASGNLVLAVAIAVALYTVVTLVYLLVGRVLNLDEEPVIND